MARCPIHDMPIINETCVECVAVAEHEQQLRDQQDELNEAEY